MVVTTVISISTLVNIRLKASKFLRLALSLPIFISLFMLRLEHPMKLPFRTKMA